MQKQMAWKGVPKVVLKIEFQNSSVKTLRMESETILGCQASLLGTLSPWAGQVLLQNSGASAEWELALPVWSVQLRLVHQSQTCWAGSQEGKLLGALG